MASAIASAGGLTRTRVEGLTNLTPGEVRPTWEITLGPRDAGQALPAYTTGDHVSVQPDNPDAVVTSLCERLRWDPNFAFSVESAAAASAASSSGGGAGGSSTGVKLHPVLAPGAAPLTVRSLLKHVLDVSGEVTPHQLRALAASATDKTEAEMLKRLCDRAPFLERVRGGYATLLSLLQAFPSVHLPLDRALSLVGPITPRYYSISSPGDGSPGGGTLSGGKLQVTFRQMRSTIPPAGYGNGAAARGASCDCAQNMFEGLCSSYMGRVKEGESVSIAVRPSSFRLPEDPATPIVMVAGGIGIAPFRAFGLHRLAQARAGTSFGPSLLLYGCRDSRDEVYRGLWEQLLAERALERVDVGYAAPVAGSPAVTPTTSGGDRKRLADSLLLEHSEEVWRALSRPEGGVVYVCGGASGFGQAVANSVKRIVAQKTGLDAAGTDAYMGRLLEGCRFVEDLAD